MTEHSLERYNNNKSDKFLYMYLSSVNTSIILPLQMKHCCVEDPSDLCSVNISGQEMSEVKEDDLALFDNVAYVNAAENFLPFGKITYTYLYQFCSWSSNY